MIQYPHCKINLGLSIVSKRPDGFHELETVFYPIALKDILEITPISNQETTKFSHSGLHIPGESNNNLCLKAYQLLKKDFPLIPEIQMHLHKIIPMGAGLGGGSSDGTFALIILNSLFKLGLSKDQLFMYAEKLGSDCPYFLFNSPCHATGKGEILSPIQLDLSNFQFVFIHPGIHIATPWAFQQIVPCEKNILIRDIIQQPIQTWKQHLINDFEAPVIKSHPIIGALKNDLYQQGAIYASMSGSGSSLFGIFEKGKQFLKSELTKNIRIDII
ncbi:MAG: 4-(cytidine 5'-diphospho)-2-C-methyl-D-erythritol kinase [Sediminibacterium sp.]|jgi:4-diphosphocytidyl-2-C-methyl-D-erythritol kinase